MLFKTLRFLSLVCAALALGLTLTHDLEIPGKHLLSGANWLAIQQSFYGGFALVGGIAEILGLLSTGILLLHLRKQRVALALTLVAALCFAGMLALFAFGNNPLNQQIASWTSANLPATWQQTRNVWDRFHAASSVLAALSLVALLRDTPSSYSTR